MTPARLVFLDLARGLATLMMVQGHTLDALLSDDYRAAGAFHLWTFVRGLTPSMFLLFSGFAFAVATERRWAHHLLSGLSNTRRFRRFGFFLLLGYLLHFPVSRLIDLPFMPHERWRSFIVVDALQCIAITLMLLQGLVLATRTPRRLAVAALCGGLAVAMLTPWVWRGDWSALLPLPVAAYLSPAIGSPFPLFPWSAYTFIGAALGGLYLGRGARDPVAFAIRVLAGGGALLVVLAVIGARVPLEPFGSTDFWTTSPNQFFLRTGLVFLVLGVVMLASHRVSSGHSLLRMVAEESLTIYFVHLCIVYGSVWNSGLSQVYGRSLSLGPALGTVALLWLSVVALAGAWNWCKRRHAPVARRLRIAAVVLLLAKLA